jgi:hypothetical protein
MSDPFDLDARVAPGPPSTQPQAASTIRDCITPILDTVLGCTGGCTFGTARYS